MTELGPDGPTRMKDGHVRSYGSPSATIRKSADRAMCAALGNLSEQATRHPWLLPATLEPLLT